MLFRFCGVGNERCMGNPLASPTEFLSVVDQLQRYNVPELEPAWWGANWFQRRCEFRLSLLLQIRDACAGALVLVIMAVYKANI